MIPFMAKAIDEVFSIISVPLYLSQRSYYTDKHLLPEYCTTEYVDNIENFYQLPDFVPDLSKGKTIAKKRYYTHTRIAFQSAVISEFNEVNIVHVDYLKPNHIDEPKKTVLLKINHLDALNLMILSRNK